MRNILCQNLVPNTVRDAFWVIAEMGSERLLAGRVYHLSCSLQTYFRAITELINIACGLSGHKMVVGCFNKPGAYWFTLSPAKYLVPFPKEFIRKLGSKA